jgi:hypothetical protein
LPNKREEDSSYEIVDNLTTNPSYPEYRDDQDPPGESPADGVSTGDLLSDEEEPSADLIQTDAWMLSRAEEIYRTSTDYMDANITNQWEKNLSHFNSQHAPGSSYDKQNFKRSRTFRPKTRANIKTQEAGMAAAAFATKELVQITAQDPTDEVQIASAKISKTMLQYRLEKSIPWFLTVQGAYQDTKNYGICVTHQYWSYKEDTEVLPAFDEAGAPVTEMDQDGTETSMGYEERTVREDTLKIDNIPPENFRFDPMCDWRNPAESSPYIVCLFPMYAGDVLEMMQNDGTKVGQNAWRKYDLNAILTSRREEYSRTRWAREGRDRTAPDRDQEGNAFTTVWAHMNIVKVNGEDVVFWTLGTNMVLTDAMKLTEAYPHLKAGQRPFTVGFSNIEAHKNYPAGDNELASGLQVEINDVANQRLDNVKLVLNKRYFVKRGAQVDLDALVRNVPGGGVMMGDPEKDVNVVNTPDVTGSSYQEQDRLSVEMDEIVGGFSQSSVQNSRNLNETVGGMGLMEQSAGAVEDYAIKVFIETWMEPCVRQCVQLEQYYETDEVVMTLAAKDSGIWQRYGTKEIPDGVLRQELTCRVDVGIGNTDPVRRVEKLIFGVSKTAEMPGMAARIKPQPIADEIFGALGHKDSSRYFMSDEEFAQEQEGKEPDTPPEIALKQRELEIREEENRMRDNREVARLEQDRELGFAKIAADKDLKLEELYQKLGVEQDKNKTTRDIAAVKEANKSQELSIKRSTGSGI